MWIIGFDHHWGVLQKWIGRNNWITFYLMWIIITIANYSILIPSGYRIIFQ